MFGAYAHDQVMYVYIRKCSACAGMLYYDIALFYSVQVLSTHCRLPDGALGGEWPVIGQFSSVGSLGPSPSQWLTSEWLSSLSSLCQASRGPAKSQPPALNLVRGACYTVCVFVEREGERERQTEIVTKTETEAQTDRQTETQEDDSWWVFLLESSCRVLK